jgi:hypothetical protein
MSVFVSFGAVRPATMRRFLLPIGVSVLFVASSPYMGLIRDGLKSALGDSFTPVVSLLAGLTAIAAVWWGARRLRRQRWRGVSLMLLAVSLAVGYGAVMRTGVADVDAVERVHFIEYGVVALLFYRAQAGAPLRVAVPMTLLIGTLVGIGEEWLQWLVPTRVGDVRDVLLNLYALGCGLLFAVGLAPPLSARVGVRSLMPWRRLAVVASVAVVAFAGFFDCAHLGQDLDAPGIGRFRSFFTAEQLSALSEDRVERWRLDPPSSLGGPFSLQDHYLVEAGAHVQRRNESYAEGDFRDAWRENALLETYYTPMLDQNSIGTGDPHRWPLAQRDEVESKGGRGDPGGWTSPVYLDRVYVSPTRTQLWLGATMMVLFMAVVLVISR